MILEDSRHLEPSTRRTAVRSSVAVWLVRHGWPRTTVAGVLAASAAAGVVSSLVLHEVGVTPMWVRYPLCVLVAYVTLLVLLGLCVRRAADRLTKFLERVRQDSVRRQFHRDDQRQPPRVDEFLNDCLVGAQHGDQAGGDARGYLVAVLGLTVILICVYFVYTAPALLSQLLIEGALVTTLYRPTTRGPDTNWLTVAVEETALPVVMIAVCITIIAIVFQVTAPDATNVAEVWRHVQAQR